MQGDEGGNGSTVSTRAQMAAESVLLACRREAAARDEEIDRRNNEQDAERLEISRQETNTTEELQNVAREQRRLASSAEPSPEESSGTSVSLPEATQATTIESARQVTRVAPEVTMDATRQATRATAEAMYQLANEGQGEGQGNTESVRISASTTGGNSTDEEDRAPVSIPIPTPGAETASQAAITAPAPPSNIPRLVRAARRPRSQPGSTPERRRTGQEGTEMRAEATEVEASRQGHSLP